MKTPLKLCVLWAGCCLMACCSTQRHRQSEIKQRTEARILDFHAMSVEQLDSLSVVRVQQAYKQVEAVTITPVGQFNYRPGSGFSGEAEKVVVYSERNTTHDSLLSGHHKQTRQEKRSLHDTIHTAEIQQYRIKTTARTGTPGWRWWPGIILIIALIIVIRAIRRRFWP